MEIQSEDPNWANQADTKIFCILVSSQAKEECNNQAQMALNPNVSTTHVNLNITTSSEQDINRLFPSALSYKEL